MMLNKFVRMSLVLMVTLVFAASSGEAGSTDDLVGSKIIVSHDWAKSTGVGEITFLDGGAKGGGDFKWIGKIKRKGNTLTIHLKAHIFNKARSSRLVWKIGSSSAVMKILDCQTNCKNPVQVEYQK